ncbi:SLAC1 family transporter [Nakamurella sp. GG22]
MPPSRPQQELSTVHLTANLFGLSFGLCGLAQCWSTASALEGGVPAWPGLLLWALAGLAWLITVVGYGANVVATGRLRTELTDPIFTPFTALIGIVPMLIGVPLASYQPVAGDVLFFAGLIVTVLLGGWLTGGWILQDITLAQWHPGYFLPTVAGGLVAAGGSAAMGYDQLAMLMFGYGLVSWLVLGSILMLRLFTQPALPTPLIPTMAIELAPPVVAGTAWFAINGNRPDSVAYLLAGYGILMVMMQFRLVSAYRRVPFGPGAWAYAFSYAAAVTVAVRWLAAAEVSQQLALAYALLALITLAIGLLLVMTIRGLVGARISREPPEAARRTTPAQVPSPTGRRAESLPPNASEQIHQNATRDLNPATRPGGLAR